jgi:7-keto-8-aminopelargonate synthetase-like enzyme
MDLFYRRPSLKTREAMSETSLNLRHVPGSRFKELVNAEKSIKKFTKHEQVKIVNSGSSAILSVMSTLKDSVMIPDQGGWVGFKKIAEFCGLKINYLPTEFGLVQVDVLEDFIEQFNPESLFITSFAGYMAEQPLKDIYKVCDDMGVIMVEDASGGIGDATGLLGNGEHAHVILASTGSPKTVNVGNGGFISTNNTKILESAKNILSGLKADPVTCAGIAAEIENAPHIISKTIETCRYLKSQLNDFREVLHIDKQGLNVGVPDKSPKKLGYLLRRGLNVNGGSIITVCPNYNRIKSSAVCIEIKNLDINCMTPENLQGIIQILKTDS